ncbi:type II toxin-antitoxin system HicA family toxin [Devosia beringensis]|uniref:type II toxin-antitoxin system HicA family toxin n=1 Tax=Devosia beringensis TaxID=2657486 RepID=UPI00186BAAC6|nr:type II toxin-antitoxin system HicA family toxin [Devosia beringensis]
MVDGYYRAVVSELRQLGYNKLVNAKGSHEKWINLSVRTLIVPRNLKSRHTANAILRDAGSSLKF